MAKLKTFIVPIDLYEHEVHCVLGFDPKAINDYLQALPIEYSYKVGKENEGKIEGGNGGLCWYSSRKITVIWMAHLPRSPYQISLLVHECVHASTQLLNKIGVPVDAKTDEALTYLVDHLTQRFLEQMWKRKKHARSSSEASKLKRARSNRHRNNRSRS